MRRFISGRIQHQLLLLVLIAMLPQFCIILYYFHQEKESEIKATRESALRVAESVAIQQKNLEYGSRQLLSTLSILPEVLNKNSAECDHLFARLILQNPQYNTIAAADSNGVMFASGIQGARWSVADRKYFRDAVKTREFAYGEYVISKTFQRPTFHYSLPVFNNAGEMRALLFAAVDLRYSSGHVNLSGLPREIGVSLYDHAGKLLFTVPEQGETVGMQLPADQFSAMQNGSDKGVFTDKGTQGESIIVAFRRIVLAASSTPYLYIRVTVPEKTASAHLYEQLGIQLLKLSSTAIIALLIAWFMGEFLVAREINRIISVAEKIGEGNLTIRTGTKDTGGEIGQLARAIDRMGDSLARDAAERKEAEEERLKFEKQMFNTQKLESLGILAGGIAHDFNNILMVILGNTELVLKSLAMESREADNLRSIKTAATRAAELSRQMLAYSGRAKFVISRIDLNNLLEEMIKMLEVSISKKAELKLNLNRPLPSMEADATQIRQIVMNLVINASEALDDNIGAITVTTGSRWCDRSYLQPIRPDENLDEGLYVFVEVEDTGCGMDTETMTRIFDPFFTTKFTGRGLGMAAVFGIVRGHKGAVNIQSEPGRGSIITVFFPASQAKAEKFSIQETTDDWKGTGTVLLVDDEKTVCTVTGKMLNDLGFTTITAENGMEALEVYKEYVSEISFVLLDLAMPKMDGEQCFDELRKINPDVKVIISSGYNEQEVTRKFANKGLSGYIEKPYMLSSLKEVIRAIVASDMKITD